MQQILKNKFKKLHIITISNYNFLICTKAAFIIKLYGKLSGKKKEEKDVKQTRK